MKVLLGLLFSTFVSSVFSFFFTAFFWWGCGLGGVIIIMIANDMVAAAIHQFCLFEREKLLCKAYHYGLFDKLWDD